jgi:hypothetical protein
VVTVLRQLLVEVSLLFAFVQLYQLHIILFEELLFRTESIIPF